MKRKALRKTDWNLVLTTISVICAVISVVIGINSNKIAQESISSHLSINAPFISRSYPNFGGVPCRDVQDNIVWNTSFIVALDLTNTGNKSISIVNILQNQVQTQHPLVGVTVAFDLFRSSNELDKWLQDNEAP